MSNAIAILEPREAPLTVEDFEKIEALVEKHFDAKPILQGRSVPKVDAAGETYGWEWKTFETGLRLNPKGPLDQRLVDAMQRPATPKIIAYHLTRLSAHKRNTKGGFGFQVIIEDACRDLAGCSEWALCKAYDRLRKAEGPFFPDLSEIVDTVVWFDAAAGNVRPKPWPTKTAPDFEKSNGEIVTDEKRARVAETLHNAGIAHSKDFCAQCKGATA